MHAGTAFTTMFLIAFITFFSAFAQTPETNGTNLLSFERLGTGAPGGWKYDARNILWTADDVSGPLGPGAARIKFKTDGEFTLDSPAREMRPEENHALVLWMKSEPPGAKVEVAVIDNDKDDHFALRETFTAEADWKMFQASAALPRCMKNRFHVKVKAGASDCTLWVDGLWMGECEESAGDNWRPPIHVAGAALEPSEPWGVYTGDATMRVSVRVVGVTTEGARLSLRAINALGVREELPSVPLDSSGVWNESFDISGQVAKPYGMVRVEATVTDGSGQALSSMSETLLARVPEPIPGPMPESYFGVHVAPREPDAGVVAKLGYKWCRIHDASGVTKWGQIEPKPGEWIWRDDDIALLRSHGLSIVGMLDSAPPWETGADPYSGYFSIWHAPKDIANWRNYVKKVVTHYAGSIDEWEVWNEPWDMNRFFNGGTPKLYAELLKAAYEEAKAANPNSVIIGVDTYPPFWEAMVLASGAYPYYDMLSWHRYDPTLQGRPNDAIARVADRLQTAQRRYGAPKPILCTEGGPDVTVFHGSFFSFADPMISGDWSEGADRYARMHLSMIAAGNKRFISYSLHNNGYYGLLTHMMAEPNYLLRPMHATLAALAHFVDGAKYETRLAPARDVSAHVFSQPNPRPYANGPSVVVAIEADGPDPEELPRPLPNFVRCFDRWANPIAPPRQATRSIAYIVADADKRDELIAAIQPDPAAMTARTVNPNVDALAQSALESLTKGAPPLWDLFSAQGSLAVIVNKSETVEAKRADLRRDPALAAKFRLPEDARIENLVVTPAGQFTLGEFEIISGEARWAATFSCASDGPDKSRRFISLTILPDNDTPDPARVERATSVVKVWETAIHEATIANLLSTLSSGPCCLSASTLNGEYFMFDDPVQLVAMMNTAIVFGPAPISKMDLKKVVVSGGAATVYGRWEIAELAFGFAAYPMIATLIEENGEWKIASFCLSAG